MIYYYEGEEIPHHVIKRFVSLDGPEGYTLIDCQIETECIHCGGSKKCTCDCGHKHTCGMCGGSGVEYTSDSVWMKDAYYDELVARARQNRLIRDKYGRMVHQVSDWWQS